MKLSTALREGAARLAAAGIVSAPHEARLLLHHALGLPRTALADGSRDIDATGFDALLDRRAAREPMALITGRQGFWTLDMAVSPATLIPRADSEALIEAALVALPDRNAVRRVLDLGTGTGCLLLAALDEFPLAWGLGVDRVAAAAALAGGNAALAGMSDRVSVLCGDWSAAISARFDLVLANPPYIASTDMSHLMPEVVGYEPASALDGGADGLDAYRRLMPGLPGLLAPGGVAIIELGLGQHGAVAALAREVGFAEPTAQADLGGVTRALVLRAFS